MSKPHDVFKEMLLEAVGDRLLKRGYSFRDDVIQIRSGLYRFAKPIGDALALVDVQLLFYAGGGPSRLEVKVWRSDRPEERLKLGVWLHAEGFDTLADELGWWEFVSGSELEDSLRDAISGLEKMLTLGGGGA